MQPEEGGDTDGRLEELKLLSNQRSVLMPGLLDGQWLPLGRSSMFTHTSWVGITLCDDGNRTMSSDLWY